MTVRREMFLIPQAISEKIVTRYGYEKLGEFTFLLSQYCVYWDNNATAEGFDFSHYSEAVLIYFDTVRDEIDEKHRQFFAQGEKMAKIAKERWEKENQEEKRREKKRQWYVDNKDKVNQKRRQNTSSDVSSDVSSDKNEVSSGVSSDRSQTQTGQGLAENDAVRIQNYELMNNKNFKKNYGKGVCENVDNSPIGGESHDLSGGLTGHNRAQGSVIKENHKNWEHKNHKKHKNRGTQNLEQQTGNIVHNPPQPSGQLPRGEQGLGKSVVSPEAVRTTIYGDTWIKIGDDFEVDLFDPEFADVDRGRIYLINGFQNFARRKWAGLKKDKWWLRDQLTRNFANRQGDVSYLFDKKR